MPISVVYEHASQSPTIIFCRTRYRWGPIPGSDKPTEPNGDAAAAANAPSSATNGTEAAAPRKRKSRWDTNTTNANQPAAAPAEDTSRALMLFPGEIVLSNGIKIVMPPALTGRHASGDPEVVALHKELVDLERMIRSGLFELPPESERSPSPPPVYDSNGVRLNTREVRQKEKVTRRRNKVIEELLKRDPSYKPPTDYKPEKKWRKLFIPYKEYPEYNFIGLIIGPRGNTHKRMQQETNTIIAIRGRGSAKDGSARGPNYDYGDDEDLHVLITGDKDEDVDAAAAMVERLLQPLDEEMNQHKQKQLRELALINGTLKETYCYLCGEQGHSQLECPKKAMEIYKLPDAVQARVDEQYARDIARLNPGEAAKADEEYQSFLAELGGTDPRAMAMGGLASGNRDSDAVKLWVGNLPLSIDSAGLRALFESFGVVTLADVKTDNGVSRGFGFVHFAEESMARAAAESMSGRVIEGRAINVRRKADDGSGGGPRRGVGSGQNPRPDDNFPPECKIYIGHIPFQVDEFILRREFERFGAVVSSKLIVDRETGRPKGYGFVTMADPAAAAAAIAAMNGYPGFDPTSRPLVVRQAGVAPDGRGGGRGHMPRPPPLPPLPPGAVPGGYDTYQAAAVYHGGAYPPPGGAAYPPAMMDPYAAYQYPGAGMDHAYAGQYYSGAAYAAYPPLPVDSGAVGMAPPPPPPLPEDGGAAPPPPPVPEAPAGLPPPPPPPPDGGEGQTLSEYERFMAEMHAQVP